MGSCPSEYAVENADPMSRTQHLCRLEKGGRQIAFLLTDMDGGGFELTLIQSDANAQKIQLFRV